MDFDGEYSIWRWVIGFFLQRACAEDFEALCFGRRCVEMRCADAIWFGRWKLT